MAIKFICSCGKHLRARDEMAARRSVCPQCGEPVGIPSLQPNGPGAPLGPMTPQERRRLARQRVPVDDPELTGITTAPRPDPGLDPRPPRPLDPEDVKPPGSTSKPRRPRSRGTLEKHWYQSLGYPIRGLHWIFALALLWTLLSALTLPLAPLIAGNTFAEIEPGLAGQIIIAIPFFLMVFVLGGYACGFLQCVLASAIQGESQYVPWPGKNLKWVVWSAGLWSWAFLAGPIVPAAAAVLYWLRAGDLVAIDWVIVVELGTLAVGYWLLAILAASRRGRYRDVNPYRVVELVRRMGGGVLLVVGVAGVLAVTHAIGILVFMQRLHDSVDNLFHLLVCWANLLFWTTGLIRLLGVWCHRSLSWAGKPEPPPEANPTLS